MKTGILTYHFSNNYGAVLQAFALQNTLRNLGHEPIIIDRTPIKRDVLHCLYRVLNPNSSIYWHEFQKFAHARLQPITRPFYTDKQIAEGIKEYGLDAIVVGSDQIWRGTMCGHSYFLNFLSAESPTKRVSYAASFGKSIWDEERSDTKYIGDLLRQFDHISVRENSGVDICHNIFGVDARLVLDPTLLHDAGFYIYSLQLPKSVPLSGKVVSYILGSNAKNNVDLANRFAISKQIPQNELYWLSKDLRALNLQNISPRKRHATVEEWLNEIRGAEYVVTNSFHCAVFSILFRKNFVVMDYSLGGNDRLHTLFELLGIESRMAHDYDSMCRTLSTPINYDSIHLQLLHHRRVSIDFIKNALK